MLVQILEQVINGLLAGAYYLLIALGLSLIFSLGGLVNLAHGDDFVAMGAVSLRQRHTLAELELRPALRAPVVDHGSEPIQTSVQLPCTPEEPRR